MTVPINAVQTLKRVVGNRELIGATLADYAGVAIDLTGTTVAFRMVSLEDGTVIVDGAAATLENAASGLVSYSPAPADVDTPGSYAIYFVDNSSPSRRWPHDGPTFRLIIVEEGQT